jgi:hypothetical protein
MIRLSHAAVGRGTFAAASPRRTPCAIPTLTWTSP